MKGLPVILGMLLAVSLLFNVVAFVRLGEEEAPLVGSKAPAPQEAGKAASVESIPAARIAEAPAPGARDSAPAPAAVPGAKTPASAAVPLTQPSLRNDPKLREVLQANEAFNAFWKDLDRVFKVRNKLDEHKYAQTVTNATSDFLELGDPNRGQFEEASKAAATNVAQARKEFDAGKKALPPKDKTNPAASAAYQQQKDAIDARYQNQLKSAVDSLKPYLNAEDARHQEFLMNAEKWLRSLAPRL